MLYMKFMLSHHRCTRGAQQLIIMKQAAGYRVFYRKHTYDGRIMLHFREHFFKGGTAYQLYLLVLEILMHRNVMERAVHSLYRYSFHLSFLY